MKEFYIKNILISKNFNLNPKRISLKNQHNFLFFDATTSGLFFFERIKIYTSNFLFYLYIYFFFSLFYNYKKYSKYKGSNLQYSSKFFGYFWKKKILTNLIWSLFQYYKNIFIFMKKFFFFYEPIFLFKNNTSWFFSIKNFNFKLLHLLFFLFQRFYYSYLNDLKI